MFHHRIAQVPISSASLNRIFESGPYILGFCLHKHPFLGTNICIGELLLHNTPSPSSVKYDNNYLSFCSQICWSAWQLYFRLCTCRLAVMASLQAAGLWISFCSTCRFYFATTGLSKACSSMAMAKAKERSPIAQT